MSAIPLINAARTNPALATALAAVPEWQRTVDVREAVQAKIISAPRTPSPPTPTSGDQLDEWLDAAITANDQKALADRRHAALTSLAGELTHTLDGILFVVGDRMLANLHDQLTTVMTAVATIAEKLDGADNANAAITQQVERHWRALPELRARYDSIRAAQGAISSSVDPDMHRNAISPHTPDELASDLMLANVDELVPGWRIADTRWVASGYPERRTPWPTEPIEQLVWLATSDAQPWVPTTEQLEQLAEKRRNRPPMNVKPIVVHGRIDRKVTTNA
ncbi:hypothetical protein [Mycolicibacterium sp. lyk4-40-TYG-92]|uniref:hypothetical protein n=1 Tax=Mycolicibacterium sp. lyk4-40-TYG-92 TaxID=3040295 RepID=UPI00254E2C9D|nr:hypothetical protein [Mycolicibacterium sp. lyk4-40-TYG-92]